MKEKKKKKSLKFGDSNIQNKEEKIAVMKKIEALEFKLLNNRNWAYW